jgi:hypothetical protein
MGNGCELKQPTVLQVVGRLQFAHGWHLPHAPSNSVLIQDLSEAALKPSRRDPLSAFGKYNDGLNVDSDSYWAVRFSARSSPVTTHAACATCHLMANLSTLRPAPQVMPILTDDELPSPFAFSEVQASIWEGMPFMIIALAWIFVLLMIVTIRTVLCCRGEVC